MTAETERIAQRAFHVALLRLVQRQVQVRVDLRIEILAVDGRGNHAVRNGEDAGPFNSSTDLYSLSLQKSSNIFKHSFITFTMKNSITFFYISKNISFFKQVDNLFNR